MRKKVCKKCAIIVSLILISIFIIICGNIFYKYRIISKIKDIPICVHHNSRFRFNVYDITNDNKIKISIDNYTGKGILGLKDPFYYGGEHIPKDRERKYVSIPEEYSISYDDVIHIEGDGINASRSYIYFDDREKYNLSEEYVDFEVCGYACPPNLLELKDGRKFIIYKKFNYLFLREVEED